MTQNNRMAKAVYGDGLRTDIGPRLRAARKWRGWTLEDLSDETTISVSNLSLIETGKRLPSLINFGVMCQALGVLPDAVMCPGDNNE